MFFQENGPHVCLWITFFMVILLPTLQNGCFWGFFSKRYLRQIRKKEKHCCYDNFESWFFFFIFSTRWYLKLWFVSNTFWTKISKTSHCNSPKLRVRWRQLAQRRALNGQGRFWVFWFVPRTGQETWIFAQAS